MAIRVYPNKWMAEVVQWCFEIHQKQVSEHPLQQLPFP
jgi:hypothetical protein